MHRPVLAAVCFVLTSIGIAAQSGSGSGSGSGAGSAVAGMQTSTAPSASGETQFVTRTLNPEEVQRMAAEASRLGNSCPVSLSARQVGSPYNREVSGGRLSKDGKDTGQSVHLSVAPRDSRRVVAATVTVHGYANKKRMVQTLGTQDGGDAARTLEVTFGSQDKGETWTELALPGFSAVTSVELKSITYADGSVWTLAAGSACKTRIDPMMLVSGR